jgi:hypothetical protein
MIDLIQISLAVLIMAPCVGLVIQVARKNPRLQ